MNFDYLHSIIFTIAVSSGIITYFKYRLAFRLNNFKNYSLEKILSLGTSSFFWVLFGLYSGVNHDLLLIESFTFCVLSLAFLAKLNEKSTNYLFGRLVPGHGKKESNLAVVIKKTLGRTLGTIVIVFIVFILLMMHG